MSSKRLSALSPRSGTKEIVTEMFGEAPKVVKSNIVEIPKTKLSRSATLLYNEDCCVGMRRLPAESIDLVLADPPYGLGNPKSMYNRDDVHVWGGYVEAPTTAKAYFDFTRVWLREAVRVLRPGGSMFIFSGWTFEHLVKLALSLHEDMAEINHLIWKYQFGVNTKRKFVSSHYHIMFWAKNGPDRTFNLECRFPAKSKDDNGRSPLYRDLEDVAFCNP